MFGRQEEEDDDDEEDEDDEEEDEKEENGRGQIRGGGGIQRVIADKLFTDARNMQRSPTPTVFKPTALNTVSPAY